MLVIEEKKQKVMGQKVKVKENAVYGSLLW